MEPTNGLSLTLSPIEKNNTTQQLKMDETLKQQQQQPDLKKLKMTTDDDTNNPTTITIKFKRRKIAIFFAYCGVGYQGMQKNPGAKTIESDLEEALFLSGAVPEPDRDCPKRFDFARSARTDKGVSAVGQVVSGRFYIDPPGLVDRLNFVLPDQIRVFGFKRATPSFNAKKFCDRRRYVYLVPVFALDPSSHPDRESVLASLGSGNELVKCLECSDRGRKVEGVMGKNVFRLKDGQTEVAASLRSSSNMVCANLESDREKETAVRDSKDIYLNNHENKGDVVNMDVPENVALQIGITQISILSNSGAAILDTKIGQESVIVDNNMMNSKSGHIGSTISENKELETDKALENSSAVLENETRNDHATTYQDTVKSDIMETDNPEHVCLGKGSEVAVFFNDESVLSGGEIEEPDGAVPKEIENGNLDVDQPNGSDVWNDVDVNGKEGELKGSKFCYGEEERERLNRILKRYVGTHNFHNFTTRIKAEDPSATRYIISFEANTVVNVEGIDFVKCEVVGQSFMLHQIRKMIGVAVAIMRNCADESLIEKAFQKDLNITVPTAPEVGLYLDECFFCSYNQKWKDTHEEVSMKAYADEAEEFKMKHIYSHIASMEQKEGSVALWLHSLNHRNYPDLNLDGSRGSLERKEDEPE